MKKEIKFNVNDYVHIKLTPLGKKVYLGHYNEYRELSYQPLMKRMPKYTKSEKKGYHKFQLWEIMQIFGEIIYNGCKMPFKTEIILQKD